MTAQLQKNDIEQEIKANGFVSVNDPACGAGRIAGCGSKYCGRRNKTI